MADPYRLYQFTSSPYCAKVRLALDYKNLPYELENIGISPRLRRQLNELGASGTLPVLELPSGERIQGSGSILRRLDLLHPKHPLYPEDEAVSAAEIRIVESWADESLAFLIGGITFKTNATELLVDDLLQPLSAMLRFVVKRRLRRRNRKRLWEQGIGRRPLHELLAELNEHIQSMETMLSSADWLAGSRFTAADAAVGGMFFHLDQVPEIAALTAQRPKFSRWLRRIRQGELAAAPPVQPTAAEPKKPAARPAKKKAAKGKKPRSTKASGSKSKE